MNHLNSGYLKRTCKKEMGVCRYLKIFFWALFLALPLLAFSKDTYDYQVSLKGTKNKELIKKIQKYSELYQKKSSPPKSLASFQNRVKGDSTTLINVLHSMGYYDGQASISVEPGKSGFQIIIKLLTGKEYKINSFRVIPDYTFLNLEEIGITLGNPAKAETLIKAEVKLIEILRNQGYLLASIVKKEYLVDQKRKHLNASLHISLGPKYYFGHITVEGLNDVKPEYVLERIKWASGDVYSPKKQRSSTEEIESGGLFRSVEIFYKTPLPEDHILPITIRCAESKHRTISAGTNYTFDEGVGISLGWKHRNLMGMGEIFSIDSTFAKQDYTVTSSYRIPYFWHIPEQDLIWTLQTEKETTTAYVETSYSLSATLEKKISSHLTVSFGPKITSLDTTKATDTGSYKLLSFPLLAKLSYLNSNLSPTKGWTALYQILPHKSFQGRGVNFITQKLRLKLFVPFMDQKIVWSGTGTAASIMGAVRKHIPTPLRLYSGSYSELPGYKYNTVSPLSGTTPTGGLSQVVLGTQLSSKITQNIGTFVGYSLGNVYATRYPKLRDKWLKSWGLGAVYYTPVGPLSIDVAFPINRRRGLDNSYQIYVNLGGTF